MIVSCSARFPVTIHSFSSHHWISGPHSSSSRYESVEFRLIDPSTKRTSFFDSWSYFTRDDGSIPFTSLNMGEHRPALLQRRWLGRICRSRHFSEPGSRVPVTVQMGNERLQNTPILVNYRKLSNKQHGFVANTTQHCQRACCVASIAPA
jgi:hypothetical protein